ncbi:hypothetical protein LCGC14_1641760, partial [marine sediment metagenome]
MATASTNLSLTLPVIADTTNIVDDFNSNMNLIDAQFAATYLAPQAKNAVTITGGSITGITDLVVSDGGTGVSTLTDGGILLGSGTGALTAMAVLTDGQMIVGNGTTDPVAESGATLRTSIGAASRALDNISSCAINAALLLGTSGAAALGSSTYMWSDLFLANEAVINFNNGNLTLTHSAGTLTCNGIIAASSYTGDGSSLTGVGVGTATALTINAKEENTSPIVKGQAVYISGSTGAAFPNIGLADADDAAKAHCIGLAAEAITQNQQGLIRVSGLLSGVDSLGANDVNPAGQTWNAGDILWLYTTAGGLTNVKPTSGQIVRVGISLYGSSNTDAILIDTHPNPTYIAAAASEDIDIRMGDNAGSNKVIFEDFADNEVASIDSNGNIDGTALTLDTALSAAEGGTGVANNALNTITFTGNFTLGLTLTANTAIQLPTSGTLVNSAVTTLSSLVSIGDSLTITTPSALLKFNDTNVEIYRASNAMFLDSYNGFTFTDTQTSSVRLKITQAGDILMGDGAWTNYVKITAAGVMTMEGTANIEGISATELGYLNTVSSNVQTQITARALKGANTDLTSVLN